MAQRAVIVGGGITGALVAWSLQRDGWQVTVLEGAHVGAGSSSRTAAGIRQQFSTPETVIGMRYSVDFYRRFPELVGGPSPLVENGYLFLLEGDDAVVQARQRVAMQRECGLDDVELLDPAETVARFPWVDGERISGATWCPSDGFLRPELVYNEAIDAVRAAGGAVRQGAPVVEGRHQGGRLQAVRAGADWHEGDLFVDATNAWSPRLADALGAVRLPVVPLKRFLWFIERSEALSADAMAAMPLVITPPGAYCRPENSERLLTGFAMDLPPEPDFSYEDQDVVPAAFSHRSGTDSHAFEAWLTLAEYLPPVGELAGIAATTSGFYGTTPDHNPFLGFDPVLGNLLRLVGFSGHGAMFGPFTAAVASALATAGRDLSEVQVLGRTASLRPFALGRSFRHGEQMVI
ncbi:MAG: FAD-binding oxidoreductase [Alphaproteobacteria bacterium]|nr:FAD-binding oxidoreductase [Alphaproteobacteria bacterium]